MLLKAGIALLALAVAVQAGGGYDNDNNRGSYGLRRNKIKNIWLPTIVRPTEHHYQKRVSASKSRRDKWEQVNTRTETDLHQKIVNSDEYVKDNVKVEYPLSVLNVNHHNHHLTVKNTYPKQINTYVKRWKKIIKPQEGRTDSYSNSESREKIVHPLQVSNRHKEVNLGTKVLPTQWVEVGRNSYGNRNNGGYNNNNNGGYRNNGNNNDEWAEDK